MKKHMMIFFAILIISIHCAHGSSEEVDSEAIFKTAFPLTNQGISHSPLEMKTQSLFTEQPVHESNAFQEFADTTFTKGSMHFPFENFEALTDQSFLSPLMHLPPTLSQTEEKTSTLGKTLSLISPLSFDAHQALSQSQKSEICFTKKIFQSTPFESLIKHIQSFKPESITFFGDEISSDQIQKILSAHKNVQHLTFMHLGSIEDYSFLKSIEKCRTLCIHKCSIAALQALEISGLVELTLNIRSIAYSALKETVKRNPKLTFLDLSTTTIKQGHLKKIIKFLPNLEKFYCNISSKATISPLVIAKMKNHMKKLKIFGMLREDFNATTLKELGGIESLLELHLFHALFSWMPELKTRLKVIILS